MRRSVPGVPSWAALFILLTAVSGVSASGAAWFTADGVCHRRLDYMRTYSCPKDAYCPMDGIAGVNRAIHPAIPCPANTVTRGLGSSVLSSCKCKTGFAGPDGVRAPYAPSHRNPHPVPHIRHLMLTTQRPGIRGAKPDCLPYEQGPCVECTVGQVCLGPDSTLLSCLAGTFMKVRLSDQRQGCASCPKGASLPGASFGYFPGGQQVF